VVRQENGRETVVRLGFEGEIPKRAEEWLYLDDGLGKMFKIGFCQKLGGGKGARKVFRWVRMSRKTIIGCQLFRTEDVTERVKSELEIEKTRIVVQEEKKAG